jgi:hypothetical protein
MSPYQSVFFLHVQYQWLTRTVCRFYIEAFGRRTIHIDLSIMPPDLPGKGYTVFSIITILETGLSVRSIQMLSLDGLM